MIVHTAWIGEAPSSAGEAVAALRRLDGNCDVRFYTDGAEVWPAWRPVFDRLSANPRMQSDILRHSLLRKYGGLWLDLDVTLTVSPISLAAGWSGYTVLRLGPRSPWVATDVVYSPADWGGWVLFDEYISSIDTAGRLSHLAFAHDMILWAHRRGGKVSVVDDAVRYPCRRGDVTADALALRCGQKAGLGRHVLGPGSELRTLLKSIGIVSSPTCSCNKRAQLMDERGCDWCESNIDQIDRWLAEEAKKRKLPYLSVAGRALIRLAIRRARKKGNG